MKIKCGSKIFVSVAFLLLAASIRGQGIASVAEVSTASGPENVKLEVNQDRSHHAILSPMRGKANRREN